jgi:hypothetical protein
MKRMEQIFTEARLKALFEEVANEEVVLSNQDELNIFLADYKVVANDIFNGIGLIFATKMSGAVLIRVDGDTISLEKSGHKGSVSLAYARLKNELLRQN